MKKILITILIAFSILINAQSDPNFKWLHPSPQGWDLKWMKIWDANNWYLAGDYGTFMKTTNGGQTWKTNNRAGWPNTQYPNTLTNWHANAAWFFDQNNGIIAGSNASGILRTSDGGETFDTLRILPGSNSGKTIRNIYFVNSNLGFICGSSAYQIQKTTDGGTTWSQLPNLDATTYYDVFATDELNITACSDGGKIYRTSNGGASWNIIQVGTAQPLYDLEFLNSTTGYVCGGVGYFHYTTDGGFNWSGGANTPTSYTNYKIRAINNEIYVAGDYTKLFKSTDNGLSWSTINLPATQYYSGFNYCVDLVGSNIIAAGRYGNIYQSTNSGVNWDLLSQRVTDCSFIRSLYVENTSGKMIALGHWTDIPGSIIYSEDGGSTWQPSPFFTQYDTSLERMQMFDNNNGYISGMYGFFAKTTDGGIHFTRMTIPFAGFNFIFNMDFLNPSTGWVVGGLPTAPFTSLVAKTTDGGLTWINQTPASSSAMLPGVDFVDENVGYISGLNFYKTINGGTDWTQLVVPGATGGINGIKAFDANNVYVFTSSQLFKTTNGGTNWQQFNLPPEFSSIFGQVWKDMNNGYLTGTLGLVALTQDGGQSWEIMNTGGWTAYGGYMVSPDTFYVTAGNGQIFRYAKPSTQTTFQLSVNINNGWNMASVPGTNPDGMGVDTWWAYRDLGANVFKYAGGYQSVSTTTPGIGYWMKHSGARTYNTGDEWPAGGIEIVAHEPLNAVTGWNLIGGYEISATASLVTTVPSGLQQGPIYKYAGGYQTAATIDPGYGYWIKLSGAGQIIIPETIAKGEKPAEWFPESWGKIILTDAAGVSYTLYAINGESDLSQYELPPAPMEGMYDIRFTSGRIAEELSNSIQTIEMRGLVYPIKVKVENIKLQLQDETGQEINSQLQPGNEITITKSTINKLIVHSGEVIAPIEYALEQNYPNPFNPSTTIKFSLPEASDVTLIIYNTLGQKVAELINSKLDAGRYSYQWNASNVSTGMYIYELRADNFVSVKKMILLK